MRTAKPHLSTINKRRGPRIYVCIVFGLVAASNLFLIYQLGCIQKLTPALCFNVAFPLVKGRIVKLHYPHLPTLPSYAFTNLTHQSCISDTGDLEIAFIS